MELLHSHLAREPPSPHDLDPSRISPCLSLIILKMMAKSPDDRYQSAEGIEQDLIHCQSCMTSEVHTADHYAFVPGRYDKSRVFKIPLKLYGRTDELLSLMHAFQVAGIQRVRKMVKENSKKFQGNEFFDGKWKQWKWKNEFGQSVEKDAKYIFCCWEIC